MNLLGWLIGAALVIATIGIHYEIMRVVSDVVLPWALKRFHDRRAVLLMIVTLMAGHILEIWIFAFAMLTLTQFPALGFLSGDFDGSLNSFLYLSAATYTSAGYADAAPHGPLRSVTASETLAGLMMIAWSASFTYLKMEKIWIMRSRRVRRGRKNEAHQ